MIYDGLLPEESPESSDEPNLFELVRASDLKTLGIALHRAGLEDALQTDGPFTVFAPTNEAFAELGTLLFTLLGNAGLDTLKNVLLYHVIAGAAVAADDIVNRSVVDTALGDSIKFLLRNGNIFIEDSTPVKAKVIVADILAGGM